MQDDLDRVTGFLGDVRRTFSGGPAPRADARLVSLFESRPAPTVRRIPMLHESLRSLPGKAAAGFVGALIAWSGLGVAGAVPGPLTLASTDEEASVAAEVADTAATDTTGTAVDEEAAAADTTATDADVPDAPTSVSEAAHIHDFDDECGNHGHYVSYFARHGEEPECATTARAAGEPAPGGTEEAVVEDDEDASKKDKADRADKAKAEKAKAEKAKGGKAKGKGGGGRR